MKKIFFGSEVKIGDDGNIYILNLFRDKKLRIHKLLDNGNYELYWEGELPNIPKNTFLNSFEIINYNNKL